MAGEDVALVDRLMAAWNEGDLSVWLDALDEYVVLIPVTNLPEPEPRLGREGVLAFAGEWIQPWDEYTFETMETSEHGDVVLWTGRQRGKRRDGGLDLEVTMTATFAFRAGRISQVRFFWERAEALKSLTDDA